MLVGKAPVGKGAVGPADFLRPPQSLARHVRAPRASGARPQAQLQRHLPPRPSLMPPMKLNVREDWLPGPKKNEDKSLLSSIFFFHRRANDIEQANKTVYELYEMTEAVSNNHHAVPDTLPNCTIGMAQMKYIIYCVLQVYIAIAALDEDEMKLLWVNFFSSHPSKGPKDYSKFHPAWYGLTTEFITGGEHLSHVINGHDNMLNVHRFRNSMKRF